MNNKFNKIFFTLLLAIAMVSCGDSGSFISASGGNTGKTPTNPTNPTDKDKDVSKIIDNKFGAKGIKIEKGSTNLKLKAYNDKLINIELKPQIDKFGRFKNTNSAYVFYIKTKLLGSISFLEDKQEGSYTIENAKLTIIGDDSIKGTNVFKITLPELYPASEISYINKVMKYKFSSSSGITTAGTIKLKLDLLGYDKNKIYFIDVMDKSATVDGDRHKRKIQFRVTSYNGGISKVISERFDKGRFALPNTYFKNNDKLELGPDFKVAKNGWIGGMQAKQACSSFFVRRDGKVELKKIYPFNEGRIIENPIGSNQFKFYIDNKDFKISSDGCKMVEVELIANLYYKNGAFATKVKRKVQIFNHTIPSDPK